MTLATSKRTQIRAILKKQGQWGEAATHFRQAVQVDPESEQAQYQWGLVFAETGRAQGGDDSFTGGGAHQPSKRSRASSVATKLFALSSVVHRLVRAGKWAVGIRSASSPASVFCISAGRWPQFKPVQSPAKSVSADLGAVSPTPRVLLTGERAGASTITPTRDGGVPIRVSVIVPVYRNASELSQCISALRAAATPDTELIVVDDASEDDVSSTAANLGVRVLRLARNVGPAAARNHGARHARGQILFFVDADVVVPSDAIARVRTILDCHAEIAAVFGSYDSRPAAPGLVSQYRNLLHHFVHQTGKAEAATFWAGCGAVRRLAFERVGGFDERRFPRPSIEDIELGYRLRRAGYRIFIDKSLQSMHLKRWTLRSIIRTDVIYRAIPWSRLILESGETPDYLNAQGSQRASVALTGLGSLLLLASPFHCELLMLAFACLAAVVFINRGLYAFFWRARGTFFAAACVPLHLLYFVCCGVGYQYAWVLSMLQSAVARRGGGADPR